MFEKGLNIILISRSKHEKQYNSYFVDSRLQRSDNIEGRGFINISHDKRQVVYVHIPVLLTVNPVPSIVLIHI